MGMRLRNIEVRVQTSNGPYGVSIPLGNGLTILRADNSSGKSTCMMAVIYALGLEGMFGPSHDPPFPEVMFDTVIDGEMKLKVSESFVRLEIENDKGESITCKRFILRAGADSSSKIRQLVHVEEGAAISTPGVKFPVRDYFVRLQHAAQHELGFHHRLAAFIGLDLPRVSGRDAATPPLYLETLLPFFFVDQLSGWRDPKARMPTYLGIPEMAKRAVEYILALDILKFSIERDSISKREDLAKQNWRNRVVLAKREIEGKGAVLHGFPDTPTDQWPPKASTPQLMYTDGNTWQSIEGAIRAIDEKLTRLVEQLDSPSSVPAQTETDQALLLLRESEHEMLVLREALLTTADDDQFEQSNIRAIDTRLKTLGQELKDYRDTKTILDRGGCTDLMTAHGLCPTCLQPMKDTLLPQDRPNAPLSLEDNIHYIKDEFDTYEEMRRHAIAAAEDRTASTAQLREREASVAQSIRELRRTVEASTGTPSAAKIGERIRLEHDLDRLRKIARWYRDLTSEFSEMADGWKAIKDEKREIGNEELSPGDIAKIAYLAKSLREQLTQYGFRSFDVAEVDVSSLTYRPNRHGYDVGLTSASDAIRLIWAYLLALLELNQEFVTNHFGFVVFDEPKQQNAQDISLEMLLKRAGECLAHNQQVIVATSEEDERLSPMLASIRCNYINQKPGSRLIEKI